MDTTFKLALTPEQQESYAWVTGVERAAMELPRRKLGMLALAATAAGVDVLPFARSPEMLQHMLHPDAPNDAPTRPFVVRIRLTDEQIASIRAITGRELRMVAVSPDEWTNTYSEMWTPREPYLLGRAVTVVPAGMDAPAAAGDRVVRLPASNGLGVFGTGSHRATRAAMLAIDDFLRPGDSVLDVGTGSGILAVAAMRLGASDAFGVDIDPAAIQVARIVVELNGLADRIGLREGSLDIVDSQYDLVIMNLLPQVVVRLAPDLAPALRANARIVTSGAVEARAKQVTRAMAASGYDEVARRADGNWVAQVFESRR